MDAQDVATSTVEPSEDDDPIPRSDALEAFEHFRLEYQPGVRCSLVALLGCRRGVGQGGLDLPDRRHLETSPAHPLTLAFGAAFSLGQSRPRRSSRVS